MTNAEALTLMMARLAGRSAVTTRALVVQELNEKIRQLEQGPVKPWFLETLVTGTMTTGQNFIDLPSAFLEEYEEGAFRVQNLEGVWSDPDPQKVPIETLEAETDGLDPAIPEGYSLFGDKFYLGPTPDQDYPYKLKCYQRTDAVVDDTASLTNPWLLHFFNFITLATGHVVALTHLQSVEIAAKLKPELDGAYDQFWRAVESRKHVNADYRLGNSEN